jgi:gas vesicle protein
MLFKKKTLQKGNLTDIHVDLVSLLIDDMTPANRKGVVVKCDDKSYTFQGMATKTKTDKEGRVYVTIIEADTPDSQGDIATATEIQKAIDRFAQGGLTLKNDVNHNMQAVDECFISESYILKSEDKSHFPDTKIGSWVAVIKFTNLASELWKKVEAGKLNGVSLYGRAIDSGSTEIAEIKSKVSHILKAIETLQGLGDERYQPAIDKLNKEIKDLAAKEQTAETDQQIKVLQKTVTDLMSTITKAINTTIKGENAMTPTETEVAIDGQVIKVKADKIELYKALADVDSGKSINMLIDNIGKKFVDAVVDFSPADVLSDISVVELDKSEEVDKGLIEDIILKNTSDGVSTAQTVAELDIKVPTQELTAHLKLRQSTVEFYRDRMGDVAFGAYVEKKLVEKTQKAVKKLLFKGDRASAEVALKGLDGIVKKMTGTFDFVIKTKPTNTTYAQYLTLCLKDFTNDALSELDGFVIYCSPKTLLDIQDEYAKRQTSAGDKFLVTNSAVTFKGIPVKPRHLADDIFIIGIPTFLILGYRSDIVIKLEHSGETWTYNWYVRTRFGTQYIPGGLVKTFKVTTSA